MESMPKLPDDEAVKNKILQAVYAKVKASFGGQVRVLLSASAPISPDVMKFYN